MHIFLLFLFMAAIVPCWAQERGGFSSPPHNFDFDIRSRAALEGRNPGLAAQRQGATEDSSAFAAPEIPAGAGLRWSRFGLPKMFLRDSAPLTAPSPRAPEDIARDFLRDWRSLFRLSDTEIDSLRLTYQEVREDVAFLTFQQTYLGFEVYGGQVKFVLNRQGQVLQAGAADVLPGLQASISPQLTPEEAVRTGLELAGLALAAEPATVGSGQDGRFRFRHPKGESFSDLTAELVVFPMGAGSGLLAWRLFVEVDGQTWYEMILNAADGSLLFQHNLYRFARGRVWTKSPQGGVPRQLVDFPAGWLPAGVPATTGNNVDAYVDTNADGVPDSDAGPNTASGRASSAAQDFDFRAPDNPATPQDPTGFKAASVTNLFYFVNRAHDYFYALGFDEAAGNFQTDNFGRGGAGADPVLARAQYGSDRGLANNSAFSATPDGTAPRMSIYLFNVRASGSSTVRDGAYDGAVVFHEYAHGVTTRLVGARTNVTCLRGAQSGAMGEGWSDYFAASFFNDPVVAAYSWLDDANGLRRASYEGYRLTYEDLGNSGFERHDDGELWAATLWDLRTALGQAVADRLIADALKATPCNPTFVDARDAVLTADQANGGANRRRIWEVFARHGMGFSASARDGSFLQGTVFAAAFDLPTEFQIGNRPPRVTSLPPLASPNQGELFRYQLVASDPDGGQIQYELLNGAPGMTIDSATGLLQWTANFVSQRVRVAANDGQGGRVVQGFLLVVNTRLQVGAPIALGGASGSVALSNLTVPPNTPVLQVTLREGVGDANLILLDPNGIVAGESYRGSFSVTGSVASPTSETLSIHAPRTGQWHVLVLSNCDRPPGPPCRTFTDVVLTGSLLTPKLLVGNATETSLSEASSGEKFFRIVVPPGASFLRASTAGGVGDVSLWLGRNRIPTCNLWFATSGGAFGSGCSVTRLSAGRGNSESVTVAGPESGDWYINVSGWVSSFGGVTLTTELVAAPTLVLSAAGLTFTAPSGTNPPAQALSISEPTGSGFSWTARVATESGGNWLQLDRASGGGNGAVAVSAQAAGLGVGSYRGTITIEAAGLGRSPQTVAVTLNVTGAAPSPVLAVGATDLSFTAGSGQDPSPQSLSITNSGGGTLSWTVTVATTSGGNWLEASPTSGTGNAAIRVSARAASLPAGIYRGTITITAAGAGSSPMTVTVTLTVDLPVITAGGVVDAAGFRSVLGRGGIGSLFGSALATAIVQAGAVPLPTRMGGVRVLVAGIPAPLFYVSALQINFQIPLETPLGSDVSVVVEREGVSSAAVKVTVAEDAPSIFTYERAPGQRDPIIVHADGRLVSPDAPGTASEVVIAYATGVGGLNNPPRTGAAAAADPLSSARDTPIITLGGAPCVALFTGLTPGLVGLVQFNIRLPATLPGVPAQLPLMIRMGSASTQTVQLAVR